MSYELLIGARLFRKESLHERTWTMKTAPIRSCKLLQSNQRARSSVRIERWSPEPKVRGSNPLGRIGSRRKAALFIALTSRALLRDFIYLFFFRFKNNSRTSTVCKLQFLSFGSTR